MRPRATLHRLAAGNDGATLVEFSIVAPVFLLMLTGTFDIGHDVYVRATVQGALQEAGRDAGLESGSASKDAIDAIVRDQVQRVAPKADLTFERTNYEEFSDVGEPEDFTDSNGNNQYDEDECFIDSNANETWDADKGRSGLGGANDIVLYTVTVTYDRLFPFWHLVGANRETVITASTTLRNQPFGTQAARANTQICPS